MSAVVQWQEYAAVASLPLLADPDLSRPIAWRDGAPVCASAFLAEVLALAAQLPGQRYAVNLCEDRYRFLVAFCAVAVAGQTNLLPGARTPLAIAETLHANPDSYILSERTLADVPAYQFVMPEPRADTTGPMPSIPTDHVIAIAYTSGSTGAPKANPKTWGAVCASTRFNAAVLCGNGAPSLVATVPAQHMYGLELSVLLPLRSRAAIHAAQPFFPADIADTLALLPTPRMLVTTPHHLRALLRADQDLPTLEAIVSATAPLDAELAQATETRWNTRVIELFGSTETCVIARRRTASGEPWHLYAGVALLPQPDGTWVSAPHFSAPVLLQDLVEVLADGHFHLRGRNHDLLEIAGKRASLADLNRRLLSVPGVRDGVVFTLDADARGVSRLAALVVAPDVDETQILVALRAAIDPVFLPRPLRRVAALPRNATGKLPRVALLEAISQP
ncbi:MAG: AMP-binding protein [Rudaea sp.]